MLYHPVDREPQGSTSVQGRSTAPSAPLNANDLIERMPTDDRRQPYRLTASLADGSYGIRHHRPDSPPHTTLPRLTLIPPCRDALPPLHVDTDQRSSTCLNSFEQPARDTVNAPPAVHAVQLHWEALVNTRLCHQRSARRPSCCWVRRQRPQRRRHRDPSPLVERAVRRPRQLPRPAHGLHTSSVLADRDAPALSDDPGRPTPPAVQHRTSRLMPSRSPVRARPIGIAGRDPLAPRWPRTLGSRRAADSCRRAGGRPAGSTLPLLGCVESPASPSRPRRRRGSRSVRRAG